MCSLKRVLRYQGKVVARYIVNPSQITLVTGVAAEPVTQAQMKLHLRVDHTTDDNLIDTLISAARSHIEKTLGIAMVERTYRADLPGFYGEFMLPFHPLQDVISVKYYSTASPVVFTTLSDSSVSPVVTTEKYKADLPKGRIYLASGETWPSSAVRHDSVQITYKSGYAPTGSPLDYGASVESDLLAAIKLIVADMYENREAQVIGQGFSVSENKTVKLLLEPYRHLL